MEETSYLIRMTKKQKKVYADAAYRNRMNLKEWILSELDNAATYNPPDLAPKKAFWKPRIEHTANDIIQVEEL